MTSIVPSGPTRPGIELATRVISVANRSHEALKPNAKLTWKAGSRSACVDCGDGPW